MDKFLSLSAFLAAFLLFFPPRAVALTVENKSPYPAVITITDENFQVMEKTRMEPHSVHEYVVEDKNAKYHIEAYVLDPNDHTGVPTFFHLVKPKEHVCLPQHLCLRDKNKKK